MLPTPQAEQHIYTETTTGIGNRLIEAISNVDQKKSRFLALVENMVNFNTYPRAIISEDASGRVAARIIKLFLEKLQRHYNRNTNSNIPILSYPQGRSSSERTGRVHSNRIKRILMARPDATKPVLIINDITVTGASKKPLLRDLLELQKNEIIGTCFLLEETSNPDLNHSLGLGQFDLLTVPIPTIIPESIHPVKRTNPSISSRIKMFLNMQSNVTTLQPDNNDTYEERRLSQSMIADQMFRKFIEQHPIKFDNQF